MSKKFAVITSIFPPTEAIERLASFTDWNLIVVGDKKTPSDWQYQNVHFLSAEEQLSGNSKLAQTLPWNSYTRKNVGYEYAISQGADIIYDTDDDNIPLDNWVLDPSFDGNFESFSQARFVNVYSFFTDKHVWPRGYPLPLILEPNKYSSDTTKEKVGVWQFLADEDPDVDAIYRLVDNTPIYFDKRKPFALRPGTFSPFNSQNTYFRKETLPLLYLPATVTFRFTDILRGFVAQPILWAAGYTLGFGESTVVQKRNPHNYLRDFESEVPVYLQSEKVCEIAEQCVSSDRSISENLLAVYQGLLKEKIVTSQELDLLNIWLKNF